MKEKWEWWVKLTFCISVLFLFQARSGCKESSLEWLKRNVPSVIWGYVFRITICWFPNVVSKSLKDISTGEKLGGAHEIESQEKEEKKGGRGKFWLHWFRPLLLPLNHWVHHLNPLFCHISNYLTTAKSGQVKNTRLSLKGSDLSPRIAVITPPQTSNPFTDLKATFNQG